MNINQDERGVILSWFLKVGLFLAVAGVLLFDVGSIVVNNFSLDSSADDVAIAVSLIVDQGIPAQYTDAEVFELARTAVADHGLTGVRVIRKGTEVDDAGVVHIQLRRRTNTLVTKYIPPLKRFTVATVKGQAGTN